MFKSKSQREVREVREGQVDTLIGPQVVIRGDLHFSGGLYIEGRIHGKVIADEGQAARLTLAENGHIEGEIRAPEVVLNGRMNGDVHATDRIELAANARVQGNVYYKMVEMAAGSMLTGRLVHIESLADAAAEQTLGEVVALPVR